MYATTPTTTLATIMIVTMKICAQPTTCLNMPGRARVPSRGMPFLLRSPLPSIYRAMLAVCVRQDPLVDYRLLAVFRRGWFPCDDGHYHERQQVDGGRMENIRAEDRACKCNSDMISRCMPALIHGSLLYSRFRHTVY